MAGQSGLQPHPERYSEMCTEPQLAADLEGYLDRSRQSGRPVIIVRAGRFQAFMSPLDDTTVMQLQAERLVSMTDPKTLLDGGVEVTRTDDGKFLVRDLKSPDRAPLEFTRDEWAAFIAGVKNREFEAH